MPSPPPRTRPPRLSELDLEIATERLRLRPFVEADVEDVWPIVSDPTFPVHMSWSAHADRSETRAFIQAQTDAIASDTGVTWALVHDGRAVGAIGLAGIRWQLNALRVDHAELGYWLARPLWGQGLMTEAARAVVQFGFDDLGLHKITVGCLPENPGSQRVIEKTGFRHVGRRREDVWRDGRWSDHLRYELTIGDWSDVSTTMPIAIGRARST